MKAGEVFGRTLREAPAEAEVASHSLLLRAGFIRQVSAGIYAWLPLGLRVLRKIEKIVREEMDRAAAQEILLPALMPRELLAETGRWEGFGAELYRLRDPSGRDFFLGPTHEELVTSLAAPELPSYRDLPRTVYQIQWKFRYAPRARGGLLRGREFLMKDAYSFDRDRAGMEQSYAAMVKAYRKVFERCELEARQVDADPGVIGGAKSQEFILASEAGEASFVECESCSYAANLEIASSRPEERTYDGEPLEMVHTPGKVTVEEVAGFLKIDPARIVKALLYQADDQVVCALVPGDRELSEVKLARVLGADRLEMLSDRGFSERGIEKGFAGPVGLNVMLIADHSLQKGSGLVTGANRRDHHFKGVEVRRDFTPDRSEDLTVVVPGERCASCDGALSVRSGIELGHVFQLGTKYSDAMGGGYLDRSGRTHPYQMGCYGLGISRMVAAIVEAHHDEKGIRWPKEVAPAMATIVLLSREPEAVAAAQELYEDLSRTGIESILDDRNVSAGVKFADAELIGCPYQVIVGRGFSEGKVEVRSRSGEQSSNTNISHDSVLEALRGGE
jgi:prolyl-tRNA synthetase